MQVGLRTSGLGCRAFSSARPVHDLTNNGIRGVTPVNARLPRRGRSGFAPDSLFAGLGRLQSPATSISQRGWILAGWIGGCQGGALLETLMAEALVVSIVASFPGRRMRRDSQRDCFIGSPARTSLAFVCQFTADSKSPISAYAAARVPRQIAAFQSVSSQAFVADSTDFLPLRCFPIGTIRAVAQNCPCGHCNCGGVANFVGSIHWIICDRVVGRVALSYSFFYHVSPRHR